MSRQDNQSLESLESTPAPFAPAPVPASDLAPGKQSFVRRFSSAASLYFTAPRNAESMVEEEENDYLELMDQDHMNDLFGQGQLADQFQRGPDPETQQIPPEAASTRKPSVADRLRKVSYWDKGFKQDRKKIVMTFAENYFWLILGFMTALCIYWGSYYHRSTRFHNIKFGIFIADTDVGQLPAIVGPVIKAFFTQVPALNRLGSFEVWDYPRISLLAQRHNSTITEEVYRQVHHHKYWGIFYVKENSTLAWYQAMKTSSTSFNPADSLLEVVYETGRDYNAVTNYVTTLIARIVSAYATFIPRSPLIPSLLLTLSETELAAVISHSPGLLTIMPNWRFTDLIPVPDYVVQAPFQIGLIYLVIFTFFQFVFTIEIQVYIASKAKGWRFILFRTIASQFSYFVLSLAFILLNLAFGIPFNKAFGHLGFLVLVCFGYLLMSSVGSSIEILVLICGAVNPALIGFVMVIVSVVNVAPTISPMELCPSFYRYGHAIPVRNAYDLFHVAYFDAWKGNVGLNIGVLCVWILLSNAAIPFLLKVVAAKKAEMEKAAEAAKEPVTVVNVNDETAANTENNAKITTEKTY